MKRFRNDLRLYFVVSKKWAEDTLRVGGVAAGVQPGLVIMYHAWEPYQFKGWKGQQEPVEAPWKALHLAGDYGQIHYRMYYAAPSHAPRGSPVEVERI